MALTERETEEVGRIAELEVRRYFDDYLNNVFPKQVSQIIKLHDLSSKAHGGVERRVNRMIWLVTGAGCVGGGVATGAAKLFGLIVGGGQ